MGHSVCLCVCCVLCDAVARERRRDERVCVLCYVLCVALREGKRRKHLCVMVEGVCGKEGGVGSVRQGMGGGRKGCACRSRTVFYV